MAKQQGERGKTGAQGAPGRVGKAGPTGVHGTAGLQGKTGSQGRTGSKGHTGSKGATGLTGKRGVAGTPGKSQTLTIPSIVLSSLHKQIESIYNELEIQMKRMAQVQAELDEVRDRRQRQPGS